MGNAFLLQPWAADETRDVAVLLANTTVFGDLLTAGGVDDAGDGLDDDVWDCGVGVRAETAGGEVCAGEDVEDFGSGAVGG